MHFQAQHSSPSAPCSLGSVVHALLVGLAHHIASLRPQKLQQLSRIVRDAALWILMRPALGFRRIANVLVEEFSTLDSQIRLKFPLSVPDSLVLPETFSINSLNACINVFMTTDTLRTSQLFEDFATINYKDCFEVKWSKDMTVFEARLPAFWPMPPKLQSPEEVYLKDETPFRVLAVRQLLTLAAHRLCARCGQEGDGRLRLLPKFPVVPLSQ